MADLKNTTGTFNGLVGTPREGMFKAHFLIEGRERKFTVFLPWTKKDGVEKKGTHPQKLAIQEGYDISYTEYWTKDEQGNNKYDYPSCTAVCFFHEGERKPMVQARPTPVIEPTAKAPAPQASEGKNLLQGDNDHKHFTDEQLLVVDKLMSLKKNESLSREDVYATFKTHCENTTEDVLQRLVDAVLK